MNAVLPTWALMVVGTAAVVTAAGVIYRQVIRPLTWIVQTLEKYGPTLIRIARQFRPDSGDSLRDQIDHLHRKLDEAAEHRKGNRSELKQLRRNVQALDDRLERVEGYQHDGPLESEDVTSDA